MPVAADVLLIAGTAVGAAEAMFSVKLALLLVPLALVAASVTVVVPMAVGVPEISPVGALAERPAGRPMTRKLVGEFVATIWYENATPMVPLA